MMQALVKEMTHSRSTRTFWRTRKVEKQSKIKQNIHDRRNCVGKVDGETALEIIAMSMSPADLSYSDRTVLTPDLPGMECSKAYYSTQ